MGVLDFLQTHIVGNHFNIDEWSGKEISTVAVRINFVLVLILYYIFLSVVNRVANFCLGCLFLRKLIQCKKMLLSQVPMFNKQVKKVHHIVDNSVHEDILPGIDKLLLVFRILIYKNLIELLLVNSAKGNIKISFTKESEPLNIFKDKKLLTTLLISNHRSINDYLLICYISLYQTQYLSPYDTNWEVANKVWESPINEVPQVAFLSWGDILSQPTRKFFWNIVFKDENRVVTSKSLRKYLTENGNRIFVIFPEVNIITTELSLIQRKLNQDFYPYVAKYSNVLYPRFGNWTQILNCFKQLSTQNDKDSANSGVKLNRFFYHLTVVYYHKLVVENAHDHHRGGLKKCNTLNVQELVPSLFELLQANHCSEHPAVHIQLTLTREEVAPLLARPARKWERHLESTWNRTEKSLQDFEMSLKGRAE